MAVGCGFDDRWHQANLDLAMTLTIFWCCETENDRQ
jgi:hypothetical protein